MIISSNIIDDKKNTLTEKIRSFNRFYTKQIGLLDEQVFPGTFSYTEARVVWELANHPDHTASALTEDLGMDAGQLSRLISGFQERGLLEKTRSKQDGRQTLLNLTARGKEEFRSLNAASDRQIRALLDALSASDKDRLIRSMQTIEDLLGKRSDRETSYILRPPRPGDYGWVVQKNGEIYANEYKWDEQYEGLTAKIVSDFVKNFDPKKEQCWIAEKDEENIGCVFLVKKTEKIAKLRLLIVDPKARGLGLGQRLVHECTRFARLAGYKKITLWTQSILTAARNIYRKEGYKLVSQENHHSFGHDLVAETWELDLTSVNEA